MKENHVESGGPPIAVYAKLGVGIALLALILVFTAQNADPVFVRFLSYRIELSQSLLIFFVLLVGIVSGFLTSSWFHWRRSRSAASGSSKLRGEA